LHTKYKAHERIRLQLVTNGIDCSWLSSYIYPVILLTTVELCKALLTLIMHRR